jgi:arylsulfatase A-like enzyme
MDVDMLKYVLRLALIWLCINLIFVGSTALSYLEKLGSHKVTSSVSILNSAILSGVGQIVLGLFGISLTLALVVSSLSWMLSSIGYERNRRIVASYLFVILTFFVLNSFLVVESAWALKGILYNVIFIMFSVFLFIYLIALWKVIGRVVRHSKITSQPSKYRAVGASAVIVSVALVVYSSPDLATSAQASRTKPDVIIIGLDSLRPDLISKNEKLMPFTTSFLDGMLVFQNAYSPLARTYPSWASILSGKYPYESGAYFNLVPFSSLKSVPSLAALSAEEGYSTIYAANERRFSNIDERYGFDQVVGPNTGLLDFVFGTVSDNPIINLFRSFGISKWLLPYVRSNRAAHIGFRPREFVVDLQSKLQSADSDRPLFLSAHFCEAHWPYFGPSSVDLDLTEYGHRQSKFLDYLRSLRVLDNQIEATLELLRNQGRLDNALLILVSDHGESFNDESMIFSNVETDESIEISDWGHGTKVANTKQSQVLMAVQVFEDGIPKLEPAKVNALVSLIDVYPTVSEFMGLSVEQGSGFSLFKLAEPSNGKPEPRIISLETGFSVPAMSARSPNMAKVFEQGFFAYQLENNGYISIKPSKLPGLIGSKEVGVFDGERMLAFGTYSGGREQVMAYDFGSMEFFRYAKPKTVESVRWGRLSKELCVRFSVYPQVSGSEFCSVVQ